MSLPKYQHVIQTFPSYTPNETFADGIGFGGTHRRSDDFDSSCLRDLCETLPILPIIVSNQKAWSFNHKGLPLVPAEQPINHLVSVSRQNAQSDVSLTQR